jgi:WD40 repeat protein
MSGRDDNGEQVILATAGYDHSIRFWQAHNGVCHRTVPHTDSISFWRNRRVYRVYGITLGYPASCV